MTRIVKEAEVRKLEILETALELFTLRGYDDVSVVDVTNAVGIAKGTFYHYFTSKADLLNQLADWQADIMFAEVRRTATEMEGDPIGELRTLVAMIVRWKAEEQRDLILTYLRVMYRDENLALRTRLVAEYIERLRPLVAELMHEGVALGLFDLPADPESVADVLVSMWRGMSDHLAELMLDPGNADPMRDVIPHLKAMEASMERTLGIAPGTLRIYDYRYLETAFEHVRVS